MAARKTSKKAATKKKPATRRSPKASAKASTASPKEPKASAKAPRAGAKEPKGRATPKPKAKATVSSSAVNRGHLFALRPRVSTAFRPEDFLAARRDLEGETFESIEAAARAVAERALALCNDPKTRRDFRPGR